ncbi:MAG: UDP-N-acetylglucosamine--N-acetylmuramyl-(pentapeptide) pyrophosphoryl-undecaprenol N-acetylglucosamine transferase, partial [Bacteroidaceae bacterium]|nr:UDP-N-acetylglucosamine--N-acetylmuramyl-(pentapeptide) pyrophosphoryl-undecaprenol N-acetylglucosamine transferase [Bacteroidaceae bacterium]
LRNFKVLWNLLKSIAMARKVVKEFRPDIAVGVGGYASGPTLWAASHMGIPTLLQEQNGYAGVTNKLLASKAEAICVAYEGMERFFPADRIVMTGNPVRQDLFNSTLSREEAVEFFGLDASKKTILVVGGSLGARTINQSIAQHINDIKNSNVQLIWQTGKSYDADAQALLEATPCNNVKQMAFISRMDMAYKAADLVISRAGASSISELCLLEKPVILVPSPNVAEDHQTKNAEALSSRGAAVLIKDANARNELVPTALQLVEDSISLLSMSSTIATMAERNSAGRIVDIVSRIVEENE